MVVYHRGIRELFERPAAEKRDLFLGRIISNPYPLTVGSVPGYTRLDTGSAVSGRDGVRWACDIQVSGYDEVLYNVFIRNINYEQKFAFRDSPVWVRRTGAGIYELADIAQRSLSEIETVRYYDPTQSLPNSQTTREAPVQFTSSILVYDSVVPYGAVAYGCILNWKLVGSTAVLIGTTYVL